MDGWTGRFVATKIFYKMKHKLTFFAGMIALLLGVGCLWGNAQQPAKDIIYQLDVVKSKLLWKVTRATGGGHHGYLLFNSGALEVTPDGRPVSGICSLNMGSTRSTDHLDQRENDEVDDMMKGDKLFAVARFPTGRMLVRKIEATGRPFEFKVLGDLTLKGVTQAVDFMATIRQTGSSIRVNAAFRIDRTRWGINYKSGTLFFSDLRDDLFNDAVPITVDLWFTK